MAIERVSTGVTEGDIRVLANWHWTHRFNWRVPKRLRSWVGVAILFAVLAISSVAGLVLNSAPTTKEMWTGISAEGDVQASYSNRTIHLYQDGTEVPTTYQAAKYSGLFGLFLTVAVVSFGLYVICLIGAFVASQIMRNDYLDDAESTWKSDGLLPNYQSVIDFEKKR